MTKRIRLQNQLEIAKAEQRDRTERQALIEEQLSERRKLQAQIRSFRERQHKAMEELNRNVANYFRLGGKELPEPG